MDHLPNTPPTVWDLIRSIGEAIGGVGTAVGVLYAGIRVLPRVWDIGILELKLRSAEEAAKAYREACELQKDTIQLLEQHNALARRENEQAEAAFAEFAAAAGTFIIGLVQDLRNLRDMLQSRGVNDLPPLRQIPEALEAAIADAQRKVIEQRKAREAATEHPPFRPAPKEGASE